MPKNPADWLPALFTKSEGTVREATTKKFSEFTEVKDGEGVQLVGLKGDSNIRVNVEDLTVEIPEPEMITTSTVMLETDDLLRNRKGQFMSTEGMEALNTQKDANRFIAEEIAKIPSQETQDAWSHHEDQIVTLENKVTALEGALGEHSFIFEGVSQNPREGQFILKGEDGLNTNMLSSGKIISFSETDRNGFTVAWGRVAEGDVLRFSDIAQQTDEIRITGQIGPSAFTYEKIGGTQDRLSETPYDFIILSSFDPAGLASIDYVDSRDSTKIGRRAIWTLENDIPWELRQYDLGGTQRSFIKIHDGKMDLGYVATPTNSKHAANKSYVDQSIAAAIANIVSQQSVPKPAQFSWLYGGKSSSAPPDGKFVLDGSDWKFNLHTHNDIFISWPDLKSWNTSQLVEMSIWRTDGTPNRWKMVKHVEIDSVKWGEGSSSQKWLQFHQKWESNNYTLTSGQEYFVTIGGFF